MSLPHPPTLVTSPSASATFLPPTPVKPGDSNRSHSEASTDSGVSSGHNSSVFETEVEELEKEINRDLDNAYGPVLEETNRRALGYPPVFDKLSSLNSTLKVRNRELESNLVDNNRKLEAMTKALDEHLKAEISAEVKKVFHQVLEVKTNWLERKIKEMGSGISNELARKIDSSVAKLTKDVSKVIDHLCGDKEEEGGSFPEFAPHSSQAQAPPVNTFSFINHVVALHSSHFSGYFAYTFLSVHRWLQSPDQHLWNRQTPLMFRWNSTFDHPYL